MAKIFAAVPYQLSFVINNPPTNQPGQVATISVSGVVPFAEQNASGLALLTDTEAGFLVLNATDTSSVLGAVNNMTLIFLINADLAWPSSITLSGLVGTQTVDTAMLPITGPSAALFGSSAQWKQRDGSLTLQLSSSSLIRGGANNPDLTIQSPGTGYIDGDLITSGEQNCSGFVGSVKTDAGGSIIQVILASSGFCNYADPTFVVVYPGTLIPVQYTIPKVTFALYLSKHSSY